MAGGLFALIIALGVVSDFADRTHTADHLSWYEDTVALGGILGNLVSIYEPSLPFGIPACVLFDAFSGIFGAPGPWPLQRL